MADDQFDPPFIPALIMPGSPGLMVPGPDGKPSPYAASSTVPALTGAPAIDLAIRECPFRTAPECGCPSVPGACSREDQPFGPTPYYSDCWTCRASDLASKPANDDGSRDGRSAP